MKLIIDIPEESKDRLNDICNSGSDIPLGLQTVMIKAIADGEPLPAGHGNLIDSKEVVDVCHREIDHIDKNWLNYRSPLEAKGGFAYIATNINSFKSIIPPDTADLYKKPQTETDYTVSDRTRQIER